MAIDDAPYILWLCWKHFYVHDVLDEGPVVVVRDKRVLDANPAAIQRGIQVGMEHRQAANLVQGCLFRLWDREAFVERQTEWLDICAEFTGIVEPIDQHIAALDLSGHPRRIETTEKLVRRLGKHMHLHVAHGAAGSKWVAELASGYLENGLAVRNPEGFLSQLPVENLLPVAPEHRARLEFLGYRTIGQVAKVPLQTLQDQFGQEGLTIALAAKGGVSEPVRALYPLDSLRECFLFESPVEDWETIRLTRNLLASRLAGRLDGRQSSFVTMEIEREDGEVETLERAFTKAIYNPLTTAAALNVLLPGARTSSSASGIPGVSSGETVIEKLIPNAKPPIWLQESNEPPEPLPALSPIVAIRVTLKQLERVRQRQHLLIESSSRPVAESAVRYVQNTFGDRAIRLGVEIVPPRRERVLREWRHATGWY